MDASASRWVFADGGAWDAAAGTRILGILNVTPDSFSDGGRFADAQAAVSRGLEMADEGADAIDVGGESTRPGAGAVPEDEEMRRVVPVVRGLRRALEELVSGSNAAPRSRVRISVDTSKARVAAAAIDAGADIVNDVTALRGDPGMAPLLARSGAGLVLMHMRGTPRTMQESPRYSDVAGEIAAELRGSLEDARRAGIDDDRIVLDPGIGFGKTADHNLEILARLPLLAPLGRPILIGVSRKSFLGALTGTPVDRRLEAGLAAGAAAVMNGAMILRVHDVAATVRMVRVLDAIAAAGRKRR
jgi:dihydropteroate synthase